MSKKLVSSLVVVLMLVAMAFSTSASIFTPSAESKPAPSVSEATGTVGGVEIDDEYISTDSGITPEVKAEHDAVVEDLKASKDVEDLVGDTGMKTPKVSNVISVSVVINKAVAEFADGEKISVTINAGISADLAVKAYVFKDDKWSEIDAKNNQDGTVTLSGHFCPVILVVDAAEDGDVTSPQTNDLSVQFLGYAIMFVVAGAACVFYAVRKERV